MPTQEFQRLQRGDRQIPASLLNAHSEAIERLHDFSAPGAGFDFGVFSIPPQPRPMFLVNVDGKDASTPPKYSWTRKQDTTTQGAVPYWPDVIHGGPLYDAVSPALYEINGNPNVPSGAVVEAWLSENGESLFCLWPVGENLSQVFDGPVIFNYQITITNNVVNFFLYAQFITFGDGINNQTINYPGTTTNNFGGPVSFTYTGGPVSFDSILIQPADAATVPLKIVQPPTPTGDVFDYYKQDGTTLFYWQQKGGDLYLSPWEDVTAWTIYQPPTPTQDVFQFYKNDRTTKFFWLQKGGDFYIAPWDDVESFTIYQPPTPTKDIFRFYKSDRTTKTIYVDKDHILQFGRTTTPGTAPNGRSTIQRITSAQKPTWTGEEGEIVCGWPYMWQWNEDDTDWDPLLGLHRPNWPPTQYGIFFATGDGRMQQDTPNLLYNPGTGVLNVPVANLTASTTSRSSLNIPEGSAPTSPTNGDIWVTSIGAFARINGVTVQLGGSPLTTKGDLYGFDTAGDRIPVGSDGYLLGGNSTEALGVGYYQLTSSDSSVTITPDASAGTIDLQTAGGSTTGTNNYQALGGSGVTLTTSYADILTSTLPDEGTYLITAVCQALLQTTNGGTSGSVFGQLLVDGSTVATNNQLLLISTSQQANFVVQAVVVTTGASKALSLQMKRDASASFSSNALGATSLLWVRLA